MTVHFFKQILSGVDYMHGKNWAHCDLKPENILFDDNLTKIKLIDFGLCSQNERMIQLAGTKTFRSPQILYQEEHLPIHDDIFALGVILFMMHIGQAPFIEAKKDDAYYKYICRREYSKYWKKIQNHFEAQDVNV